MNWKEIGIKVLKGAVTAATASIGTMKLTGVALDKHAILAACAVVGGAAFHGAWNVAEQYLSGKAP